MITVVGASLAGTPMSSRPLLIAKSSGPASLFTALIERPAASKDAAVLF